MANLATQLSHGPRVTHSRQSHGPGSRELEKEGVRLGGLQLLPTSCLAEDPLCGQLHPHPVPTVMGGDSGKLGPGVLGSNPGPRSKCAQCPESGSVHSRCLINAPEVIPSLDTPPPAWGVASCCPILSMSEQSDPGLTPCPTGPQFPHPYREGRRRRGLKPPFIHSFICSTHLFSAYLL